MVEVFGQFEPWFVSHLLIEVFGIGGRTLFLFFFVVCVLGMNHSARKFQSALVAQEAGSLGVFLTVETRVPEDFHGLQVISSNFKRSFGIVSPVFC